MGRVRKSRATGGAGAGDPSVLPAQATLRTDHALPSKEVIRKATQYEREPTGHGNPEEYPYVTNSLEVLHAGPYVTAPWATAHLKAHGPHWGPY